MAVRQQSVDSITRWLDSSQDVTYDEILQAMRTNQWTPEEVNQVIRSDAGVRYQSRNNSLQGMSPLSDFMNTYNRMDENTRINPFSGSTTVDTTPTDTVVTNPPTNNTTDPGGDTTPPGTGYQYGQFHEPGTQNEQIMIPSEYADDWGGHSNIPLNEGYNSTAQGLGVDFPNPQVLQNIMLNPGDWISPEATQNYTNVDVQDNQFMTQQAGISSGATDQMRAVRTDNLGSRTASANTVGTATGYTADQINPNDPNNQMGATVRELNGQALVDTNNLAQSLSPEAYAQWQQEELDRRATIQGQLAELLPGDGSIPVWAQPAVDMANAAMAERGVGRSNVARDTLYNAVIGSALQIAQNDAGAYKEAWLTNMDAKLKTTMLNASTTANMDMQNATAIQQAQAQNAQAFLQMQFKNMDNVQRTNEINLQARQQVLLSNQSANNAALQFNAESQDQVNQFVSQLQAQLSMDNSARTDAMTQFAKTSQIDLAKSIDQMNFNREQFNQQLYAQIQQSNVEWRRQIATIDNSGENAINQANAMNAFNLSTQAMADLWQQVRDEAYWTWTSGENIADRMGKLALAALTNESAITAQTLENEGDMWQSIGGFVTTLLGQYLPRS